MATRKWHKGPPPHVGWWNASNSRNHGAWRWWNGKRWSDYAIENASPKIASLSAKIHYSGSAKIEWANYWPENARVPRINPGKK